MGEALFGKLCKRCLENNSKQFKTAPRSLPWTNRKLNINQSVYESNQTPSNPANSTARNQQRWTRWEHARNLWALDLEALRSERVFWLLCLFFGPPPINNVCTPRSSAIGYVHVGQIYETLYWNRACMRSWIRANPPKTNQSGRWKPKHMNMLIWAVQLICNVRVFFRGVNILNTYLV